MPFERPALNRLTIIFGIASLFHALAGISAMQLGDHLIARAKAPHHMQVPMEMPLSAKGETAPFIATSAAVR